MTCRLSTILWDRTGRINSLKSLPHFQQLSSPNLVRMMPSRQSYVGCTHACAKLISDWLFVQDLMSFLWACVRCGCPALFCFSWSQTSRLMDALRVWLLGLRVEVCKHENFDVSNLGCNTEVTWWWAWRVNLDQQHTCTASSFTVKSWSRLMKKSRVAILLSTWSSQATSRISMSDICGLP